MWVLADRTVNSRLLLGTARYPSPAVMQTAIQEAGTEVITVSLRRETAGAATGERFWDYIKSTGTHVLPNTAGCHTVKEAIATAHMARDLFDTNWIKLEIIGHDDTLQPDPFGLVEAARILNQEGFEVFPYTTDDLMVAEKLVTVGCRIIMPWGSPIGTGQGLRNRESLKTLRQHLKDITLIIDAGIGRPSHATEALEMGFDGVLLNTAVALSPDPVGMAKAFGQAVSAGRLAYEAGLMNPRSHAVPSTPVLGTPFWHGSID